MTTPSKTPNNLPNGTQSDGNSSDKKPKFSLKIFRPPSPPTEANLCKKISSTLCMDQPKSSYISYNNGPPGGYYYSDAFGRVEHASTSWSASFPINQIGGSN